MTTEAMKEFIGGVLALTASLAKHTGGGRGVRRIAVSPQAGVSLGIQPGKSVKITTPGGDVEVFCEVHRV